MAFQVCIDPIKAKVLSSWTKPFPDNMFVAVIAERGHCIKDIRLLPSFYIGQAKVDLPFACNVSLQRASSLR